LILASKDQNRIAYQIGCVHLQIAVRRRFVFFDLPVALLRRSLCCRWLRSGFRTWPNLKVFPTGKLDIAAIKEVDKSRAKKESTWTER
jgi:hypothetical protein